MSPSTRDHLGAVLQDLAELVDGIDDGRLADPTPCTEYDVAALREHVLGWLTTFAAGFADPDGRAPRADLSGYRAPADPAAAVRAAADQLDRALRDGAADRPLWLGEASMPGELALSMILWEYQMHGWDLAAALGRPWDPPGVAESLEFAPGMLSDDYQGEGKPFGPRVAVPDDAPPLDRLLGFSGRDPHWKSPAG
ncbi:MAG TPA: TIGR03086 family metal-binding protein [Pseudonocardia sp.]|jgi:uncharacterized protein (TIGR03086 family)